MNNNIELVLLKKPVYGCKSCGIGIFDNKDNAVNCCGIGWTYKDVYVNISNGTFYNSLDGAFKSLSNDGRNMRVINREFRIKENTKFNWNDVIKIPSKNVDDNKRYLVVNSKYNEDVLYCDLVECFDNGTYKTINDNIVIPVSLLIDGDYIVIRYNNDNDDSLVYDSDIIFHDKKLE